MKFTVLVAALLVAVVSSSVVPASQHSSNKDWYETATFYQIYPRSFADSDGDGVGDITGIISKLPHLKDIGVSSTWLSPIFKSPMKDFGYDISDFYDIDPIFGTMEDLEELFAKADESDIKIILDFVPNHSSDQCEWFKKSVARDPKYENFYIWHDGKLDADGKRIPPNNWNSVFYGPAWTWNEQRQQFYFHQFIKEQPDLNFRNPAVVEEMKNLLKFWLKKGAAGFRVDAVNHMFEVEDLRDEPINDARDPLSYVYTRKDFTKDLDENYDIVMDWRMLLDDFQNENGGYTRIMMTEAYTNDTKTVEYYGKKERAGAHIPFNFALLDWTGLDPTGLDSGSSAENFLYVINRHLSHIPEGKVTNWVMGNHDLPRIGSRFGSERIDALTTLVMTLPGIAVTYNGEEIGMMDNRDGITFEETVDPQGRNRGPQHFKWFSRDPVRTPFQWDNSNEHAGFSNGTGKTWLPVNPNYKWLNLKDQKVAQHSYYKYYKELIQLRKEHTMIDGSFEPKAMYGNVLAYVRALSGYETFLVLINFAEVEQTINVSNFYDNFKDESRLKVVVAGSNTFHQAGDFVPMNAVYLRKHEVVVLTSCATTFTVYLTLLMFAVIEFIVG